jgi:hypothetical protein
MRTTAMNHPASYRPAPKAEPTTFADGTPCLSEAQIQRIIEKAEQHTGMLRNNEEIKFVDDVSNMPVNWRLSKAQDKWLRAIAFRVRIAL